MQPNWLCVPKGRKFEKTFGNSQWKEVKHMQPVWLCRKAIWRGIYKCTVEKSFQCNQWINVTIHPQTQEIWGYIWKYIVEKSQTNATNVILPLLGDAVWGQLKKQTLEKCQTNANNVTLHSQRQAIWGDIWKHRVEKSQTDATSVTLHPLRQTIWKYTWKLTVEKSQTNATNVTLPLLGQTV